VDDTVLLAGLFFVAAVLYASVGHAGASGYLAAMALVGVAAEVMRPTALLLNVLVASVATQRFLSAGRFSWRTFWPFAVTSIPAAFVGGRIHLPPPVFKPLVGIVLLYAAARLLMTAGQQEREDVKPPGVGISLIFGAALGLLSGLVGVGGGIFLSPLLIFAGWATIRVTAGVSALFILVNSIAGLAGNLTGLQQLSPVIGIYAVAAGIGGTIGSQLGSRRLPSPMLRRILGVVLIVAGLKMCAGLPQWLSGVIGSH
jgi:uncharacterized membrane protein YfcA